MKPGPKPSPMPPMVTLKFKVPAPMAWAMEELAESEYGVTLQQWVLMTLARGMRKPRGPKVDLTLYWKVYRGWLERKSNARMAEEFGVSITKVRAILTALGLKSVYRDYSEILRKAWETRKANIAEERRRAEEAAAGYSMTPGAIRNRRYRERKLLRQAEERARMEKAKEQGKEEEVAA